MSNSQKEIGKLSDKFSFPQSFIIGNESVSNQMQIAESFNTYFGNLYSSTNKNIPS